MSNRPNDAVSIQLRNLDGVDLEEESDGETSTVKKILIARDKAKRWWDTVFLTICAFAVLIDPLFCYIYVITRTVEKMCIDYDVRAVWTYIGLRIVIDVFYIIDVIICLRGICKERKGKIFGVCCCKPKTEQSSRVISLKQVTKIWLPILPRILVAIPIPEVVIGCAFQAYYDFDPFYAIFIIVPFQYVLRIFLIYGSKRWRPVKETTTGRWLKPLLDFLPFILASHLFGALWYRLAVQRVLNCWDPHSRLSDSGCYDIAQLQPRCPIDNENKMAFDFGIYFYAHQSKSTSPFSLPRRITQSFWWALRNLSSFGSNLPTSMDTLEIFFSIVISISGMALFLVYLNARVKESQERSYQVKQKERRHLLKPDIDLWFSKNVSKLTKDLKPRNKKTNSLKTVIIENIYKLEENKTIDLQNIIFVLPPQHKRSIRRLLCLASLKKVPMLANLNEKMLKVICEHLKPVIYIEDNYIVQEGKPFGMMLFIIQGAGCTYTIGNNDGAKASCGFSSNKWLRAGDYYGEELLNWAFKCPSYSNLPISTRTVMSQEKVEAFALRASDLKSIVSIYWWHFSRNLPYVQLAPWSDLAASSIQAAWHKRRAKSSEWDKFSF